MDSPTPLERLWPLAALVEAAVVFHLLDSQIAQFHRGGGDTHLLFLGENRVAVATPGTMVKRGMIKCVEVLLQFGPMLLFRLVEKSGFRSLAAVGGDRIPIFPEKEPVAVAT